MSGIQHTWILFPVRSIMSWVAIGMSLPSLGRVPSPVRWENNNSHCEEACKAGSPMPRAWKVLNKCLPVLTVILNKHCPLQHCSKYSVNILSCFLWPLCASLAHKFRAVSELPFTILGKLLSTCFYVMCRNFYFSKYCHTYSYTAGGDAK